MATKLAVATGNLTAAGTWVSGDTGTNAVLLSTSASTTALTTSNQDSATFTLSANAMQYILLRLGSRASGSPSNKITITLVNSTAAGLRVPSAWVVNVSDLPVCTTAADDGGYILLKASATWTPNGTDVYLVRMVLDNTTTAVSFCTNGTAANWQRAVGRSATSAAAATDDMHVAAQFSNSTNPATRSTFSVTMDQTAATDYGSANTSYRIPTLAISAGDVTSGTTASTAYILQLSGWCAIFAQGTLNMGTVATPVPRGSGSSTLQFDCAADGDFGLIVRNGTFVGQGLSRTSGKNVVWTLLTADVAAAGTAMTVADDTGWLSGDTCAVASTSRTGAEAESFTLNGNAGASSLTASAGLGAAHKGQTVEKIQAEVVLLTRSVVVKSVSTTAMSTVVILSAAQVDCDWVAFQNMGSVGSFNFMLDIQTVTGSATFDYCALQQGEFSGVRISGALSGSGVVTLRHLVGYSLAQVSTSGIGFISLTASQNQTGVTIDDVVAIMDSAINSFAPVRFTASLYQVTFTNARISSFGGASGAGIEFQATADHGNSLIGPLVMHSGASSFLSFTGVTQRLRFADVRIWHTTGAGIDFNTTMNDVQFTGTTTLAGCSTGGVDADTSSCVINMVFADLRCYGTSFFSQPRGMMFDGGKPFQCRVLSGDFGTASGNYVAHTTADIDFAVNASTGSSIDLTLINTNLASTTPIGGFSAATVSLAYTCRIRLAHYNRSATSHQVKTLMGDVVYETGTVDVSPSIKMTPASTVSKIDTSGATPTGGFYVPCDSGVAVTVSIKVQKDASYNGNAPRLILRSNAGIGVTADTVIATFSAGSGSFQTLSGATISPTAKGVMEFIVDCDGTAGNIFVDTFTVANAGADALSGLGYWYDGSPC